MGNRPFEETEGTSPQKEKEGKSSHRPINLPYIFRTLLEGWTPLDYLLPT